MTDKLLIDRSNESLQDKGKRLIVSTAGRVRKSKDAVKILYECSDAYFDTALIAQICNIGIGKVEQLSQGCRRSPAIASQFRTAILQEAMAAHGLTAERHGQIIAEGCQAEIMTVDDSQPMKQTPTGEMDKSVQATDKLVQGVDKSVQGNRGQCVPNGTGVPNGTVVSTGMPDHKARPAYLRLLHDVLGLTPSRGGVSVNVGVNVSTLRGMTDDDLDAELSKVRGLTQPV